MKKIVIPVVVLVLLGGCSGAPKPTASASPVTERAALAETSFTSDAQSWAGEAGQYITAAVEQELGRYLVSTSIADPRGADGSAEARSAIALCQAVRDNRAGAAYVRVDERDGTAFVIWQPGGKVAGKSTDECTEV